MQYCGSRIKSTYPQIQNDLARPLQGRRLQGVLRPPRLGAQPRHPVLRRAQPDRALGLQQRHGALLLAPSCLRMGHLRARIRFGRQDLQQSVPVPQHVSVHVHDRPRGCAHVRDRRHRYARLRPRRLRARRVLRHSRAACGQPWPVCLDVCGGNSADHGCRQRPR